MGLRPSEIFYSFSAGIDFRRQNLVLTSKVDSRAVRVDTMQRLELDKICYLIRSVINSDPGGIGLESCSGQYHFLGQETLKGNEEELKDNEETLRG